MGPCQPGTNPSRTLLDIGPGQTRITGMDIAYLSEVAEFQRKRWWAKLRAKFPQLPETVPTIKLNNRLKTTAGYAYYETNHVDLSVELFWQYTQRFCCDTIPHELAHLAAYYLFKDAGHGKGWKHVIAVAGIETTRCHDMINHIHEKRKARK